jgi:hypothetical protein
MSVASSTSRQQMESPIEFARFDEKRRIVTIAYRVYPSVVEYAASIFRPDHLKSDEEKFHDRMLHHWEQSSYFTEFKNDKKGETYKNLVNKPLEENPFFKAWKQSGKYAKVEKKIKNQIEKKGHCIEVFSAFQHNETAKSRLEKRPLHSVLPANIEDKYHKYLDITKPVAPAFEISEEYREYKDTPAYKEFRESKEYSERLKQRWQQSVEYKEWKKTSDYKEWKKSGASFLSSSSLREYLNGENFREIIDRNARGSPQHAKYLQRPEVREWTKWVDAKKEFTNLVKGFLRREVHKKGTGSDRRMRKSEVIRVRSQMKNDEEPDHSTIGSMDHLRAPVSSPNGNDGTGSGTFPSTGEQNFHRGHGHHDRQRRNAIDYGRGTRNMFHDLVHGIKSHP